MRFLKELVSDKDHLVYFILGGIWWSILFLLISLVRMGLLVSQGKLVL